MGLIDIDTGELFDYLNSKDHPVEELELIKKFTGSISNWTSGDTLYARHFSLYHALYKIKFMYAAQGYYMHLHPMRIMCAGLPGKNQCHHYFDETGIFCCNDTNGYACVDHDAEYIGHRNSLIPDYLSSFYLDAENISFAETDIFKKFYGSLKQFMMNRKEIEIALKLFGIAHPDKKSLSRKYRELAVKYHPDKNGGSGDSMKELNAAYTLLREIYF